MNIEFANDDRQYGSSWWGCKEFSRRCFTYKVYQIHEKQNLKSLNKLQDVLTEGKKVTTLEILPFIVNLGNFVQAKKYALQKKIKCCEETS